MKINNQIDSSGSSYYLFFLIFFEICYIFFSYVHNIINIFFDQIVKLSAIFGCSTNVKRLAKLRVLQTYNCFGQFIKECSSIGAYLCILIIAEQLSTNIFQHYNYNNYNIKIVGRGGVINYISCARFFFSEINSQIGEKPYNYGKREKNHNQTFSAILLECSFLQK